MKNKYLSLQNFRKNLEKYWTMFLLCSLTLQEGMLKRDGNIHTQIVTNCKAKTLIPIEFSQLDQSTIYSDFWKAYDGLVDYGAAL